MLFECLTLGTSPEFSEKNEFGLFSRTVAPETDKAPALLALMNHYNWKQIVLLYNENDVVYSLTAQELGEQYLDSFAENHILFRLTTTQGDSQRDRDKEALEDLHEIQRSGIRITLLLTYLDDILLIATHAQRRKMCEPGWAWLSVRKHVSKCTCNVPVC